MENKNNLCNLILIDNTALHEILQRIVNNEMHHKLLHQHFMEKGLSLNYPIYAVNITKRNDASDHKTFAPYLTNWHTSNR